MENWTIKSYPFVNTLYLCGIIKIDGYDFL